ncbi:hypothetical protein [Methylibium petroleiphilum]|jgi:hypothetical protein|uniref:hypothetical protein n=1 Tax=Methylibium petroleiphilum TaxID=105560 RepID=UPI001AC267FC|nr:hypothetical protein [Methylibium petroleiphilum]MBN9206717.1 hypothetical protein [Methylibium petroleiphilum]
MFTPRTEPDARPCDASRTRGSVRDLKRAVRAGARPGATPASGQIARECALSLLERSIGFGHRRLAVIRYAIAVSVGADVPHQHHRYCADAAASSGDPEMLAMFHTAASRAVNRLEAAPSPP